MRTRMNIKNIKCSDYLHVYAMPLIAPPKSTRRKRFNPTRESMVLYNEHRAAKWLEELLEANFDDNDYLMGFNYASRYLPQSDEEATHQAELFVRRLQYRCKQKGKPAPLVVWDIEKGEKSERYHHHMFIKCDLSRDDIEKIWGKGTTNTRRLQFDENGLTGLANYVQKFKSRVGVRRWHSTNNLKKPIQHENNQMSTKQFNELAENLESSAYFKKHYKDYYLNRDSVELYRNDINGCEYLYFKLYRIDSKYINRHLKKYRS